MRKLVEEVIDLRPGQEWYSKPFDLMPGETLHQHAVGTVPVYMAVVDTARFDQLKGPNAGRPNAPWPFDFGTDKNRVDRSLRVDVGGPFVAVVRLGVFNPAGRVRVTINTE